MTNMRFGPRGLVAILFFGLLGGIGLGLVIAWLVWPVQLTNVDVTDLKGAAQDDYIVLTASAFTYDQDLDRAVERLTYLNDKNINDRTSELAKSLAYENNPDAAYVAALAIAIGNQDDALSQLVKVLTPTATPRPSATTTRTPAPSTTPSAVPSATQASTRTLTPRPRVTPPTPTKTLIPVPGTAWQPGSLSAWPGGVSYVPVNVAGLTTGQKYWHLSKAIFCDLNDKHDYCQDMPGGGQQEGIWVSLIGESGARESGSLLVVKPDGTNAGVNDLGPEKAVGDLCNCNYAFMANGWPIQVNGAPSDKIAGLALPANFHVRYFITFQLLSR